MQQALNLSNAVHDFGAPAITLKAELVCKECLVACLLARAVMD